MTPLACVDEAEYAELARDYGPCVRRAYDIPTSSTYFDEWVYKLAKNRRAEVAMVILNPAGRVLTHTKSFYPAGAFRIPTGGIGHEERVLGALRREVWEETGLEAEVQRLLAVIEYRFTDGAREVRFATYLFVLRADGHAPCVQDANERITEFQQVDVAALHRIAVQLEGLSGGWNEWGRFRAVAHRVAAETLGA
ncbi:MAG: NUDIX hydrolase [Anaerolineae bacterium]|nr:NUDIX hydrolase [Anaerolineae bacterium]